MLKIYGRLMPLRILEEIHFWKTQEKEHTVVIRELLPNLEAPYRHVLSQWEDIFAKMEAKTARLIEQHLASPQAETDLTPLIRASFEQSREFMKQLHEMMKHSQAVAANLVSKTVILHIIDESEYFLIVLNAYLPSSAPPPAARSETANPNSEYDGKVVNLKTTASQPATETFKPSPAATSNDLRKDSVEKSPIVIEGATPPTSATPKPVPIGKHTLPPLPYAYDALEPYIDAETMRLHHDIHHQSYVDGLNDAEKMLAHARETGDFALIKHWEREVAFNGAGHYLHTIFWNIMKPDGGGKATGPIAKQIEQDFGSFNRFKKQFSAAAEKVEGGGWAILVWSPRSHRLAILQAEKHQNLSQWDVVPLLVLDVWEHAYYLKYKTERKKYIEAWWNTVNWEHVNERFEQARKLQWKPY